MNDMKFWNIVFTLGIAFNVFGVGIGSSLIAHVGCIVILTICLWHNNVRGGKNE